MHASISYKAAAEESNGPHNNLFVSTMAFMKRRKLVVIKYFTKFIIVPDNWTEFVKRRLSLTHVSRPLDETNEYPNVAFYTHTSLCGHCHFLYPLNVDAMEANPWFSRFKLQVFSLTHFVTKA